MLERSKRALRRGHAERLKQRARRVMRLWGIRTPFDEGAVGITASTHCRPCSCWMCRGHKDVLPPRERPFFVE